MADLWGDLNLRENLEVNPEERLSSVEYLGKPSISAVGSMGSGEDERAIFSRKFGSPCPSLLRV